MSIESTMTKDELKLRVQGWAAKIGVRVGEIHIRRMKNKWASMTSDGARLTLNDALLDQPNSFVDYVLVHELVHLKIPNHGKLFKSLVRVHLPSSEY